jgi:hypothetical protein
MGSELATALAASVVLCLIQYLAFIPWFTVLNTGSLRTLGMGAYLRPLLLFGGIAVLVIGGLIGYGIHTTANRESLLTLGRFYGAALMLQLLFDFLVVVFVVLLGIWPRGAAVGLAAFAEGVRQPMFWLLTVIGIVLMMIMPILPYFTFGEDLKMVKELGYDTIMLLTGLFVVLAASMSISEEIEGRTAITLMSKPVSRRQFLLGKFVGILMAAFLMTGLLAMMYFMILWFKPVYDREDFIPPQVIMDQRFFPEGLGAAVNAFWAGILWWFAETAITGSGLVLGFCQVMVLLAIAVSLATRLPMVVNVPVCAAIFLLGHLTPILAQVSDQRGSALLQFVAQLFAALLPGLDFLNVGPALTRDPLPETVPFLQYMALSAGYAVIYTAIALLFGLILFEDRDLA